MNKKTQNIVFTNPVVQKRSPVNLILHSTNTPKTISTILSLIIISLILLIG